LLSVDRLLLHGARVSGKWATAAVKQQAID